MPGIKASIAGTITIKLNGVTILCASLKLLALTTIAANAPAKNTDSGINIANSIKTNLTLIIFPKTSSRSSGISGKNLIATNKPVIVIAAAAKPTNAIVSTFPIRILNLDAGTVNNVSIVPLSFSPVIKSKAGYIHPVKQKMINK